MAKAQVTSAAAQPASRARALPLALLIVLVSFSANSLITRLVVQRQLADAGLLSELRFVSGAIMLLAIAIVRRAPRDARPGRRHVLPVLCLGAYALLISYGYQHIGASAGTFVFYAAVFLSLVCVDAYQGNRPSPRRVAAALLALSGLGVLAASQLSTVTPLGVILLAGTGITWGLYTAAGRGAASPLALTTANFALLALVLVVPFVLTLAGTFGVPRLTSAGLAWGIVMGAGTTACAYPIWYWCLRHITGTQAALFQLGIPILTGAAAVLLLGEPFSTRLAIAGGLVILGLGLGMK